MLNLCYSCAKVVSHCVTLCYILLHCVTLCYIVLSCVKLMITNIVFVSVRGKNKKKEKGHLLITANFAVGKIVCVTWTVHYATWVSYYIIWVLEDMLTNIYILKMYTLCKKYREEYHIKRFNTVHKGINNFFKKNWQFQKCDTFIISIRNYIKIHNVFQDTWRTSWCFMMFLTLISNVKSDLTKLHLIRQFQKCIIHS